eukprot:TRINITY_DN1308_c0_g1_i4.p1 TRINITY_DN1308_c0_g1~~TRINITY_DN1308_c0_g1_i4.p1  ORF type:complete len:786 (-),score=195.75 TRINITY_DN1308_c0_g1_i4:1050-3407(-)
MRLIFRASCALPSHFASTRLLFKASTHRLRTAAPVKFADPCYPTMTASEAVSRAPSSTAGMKDIGGDIPKDYDPKAVEAGWYEWWDSQGFFRPLKDHKPDASVPAFTILIPPPNVTGTLHLGHALTTAVQDALIRWHRMCGHSTLYIPGTDHAGIATQVQVERKIMVEEGVDRHALGREEFLRRVWSWREEYGDRILTQFRRIGASVDWSRVFFTMDGPRAASVQRAFVALAERGKVFRATRLVHWCCTLRSAISDVEVVHEDIAPKTMLQVPGYAKPIEFGYLLHFAYPVAAVAEDGSHLNSPDPAGLEIVVATTRPETILADAAVAVHPEDPRYKHLHGRRLVLPFRAGTIPIVLDTTLVKMEFGTGAVKVTPAHDHNDFECGKRHGLPVVSCFTEGGLVVSDSSLIADPSFHALKRFDAREVVYKALLAKDLVRNKKGERPTRDENGNIIQRVAVTKKKGDKKDPKAEAPAEEFKTVIVKDFGKEPHAMAVATCQRTHDVIEPFLKPQWYIDCDEMAKRALDAVEVSREIKFVPEEPHVKTWRQWLGGIRPWCVSRQTWWGHRIPAFKVSAVANSKLAEHLRSEVESASASSAQAEDDGSALNVTSALDAARRTLVGHWVVAADAETAQKKWREQLTAVGLTLSDEEATMVTVEQDPDVLDTWFSSGLLPFSANGWPDEGHLDLANYFPTSLLETGHDILFFWVARMVMLSYEFTNRAPFHTVYLHAMVRDKEGKKMSKTRGNVLDPLDFVESITLDQLQARTTPPVRWDVTRAGRAWCVMS